MQIDRSSIGRQVCLFVCLLFGGFLAFVALDLVYNQVVYIHYVLLYGSVVYFSILIAWFRDRIVQEIRKHTDASTME